MSSSPALSQTSGASLRAGTVEVLPLLLAVAPFGLIVGVAAAELGIGIGGAAAFSVGIFAGASQLAALDLLATGAPVWVAVTTVVVINLRMLMYSASLAPHLAQESGLRRGAAAYLLTDQAYALTLVRAQRDDRTPVRPWWFFMGAGATLWVTWQATTVLGVVLGATVPDSVPLGFAVPLVFLSLLAPNVTDRPTVAAALSAAAVATLTTPLPANLGMPAGALTGVVVGWVLARRKARR